MSELWQKHGAHWLLTLFPAISALLIFSSLIDPFVHTGLLIGGLVLWTLFLIGIDRAAPVAGPVLALVVAGLLFIRIFDGVGIFTEIALYFSAPLEEAWIAVDLILMLALMVLSTVLMYLVRYFYSRLLTAVLLAGFWISSAIMSLRIPKAAVILLVPSILFSLIEVLHRRRKEKLQGAPALFLIVCLFSLLLFLLPFSEEPYPYKWLHRAWDGVEELWKKIDTQLHYRSEGGTEFSMDFNGPGGEGGSVGAYKEDDEPARELRVWSDFGDESVIYLPGKTFDAFDGRTWHRTLDDELIGELFDWNYDTAERVYALWRYDRQDGQIDQGQDHFRRRRLEITYREMDTRTLFTTPGLLEIKNDAERFPYQDLPGRSIFDYTQEKESRYTLFYLENNTKNLSGLIEASEGYTYDPDKKQSWGQISGDYSEEFLLRMIQTTQMEESLSRRAELIHEYYLPLPEDLPDEIRELAGKVTQGCSTDFEKLTAIERYLQENYTYTLTPSLPGNNEDLLLHMVEVKEGYCTWFATASAVMLRTLDIPARYVEGYRTVIPRQTSVILRHEEAHAWCEAYIEGYGWYVVEATPGYVSAIVDWEKTEREDLPEEEIPGEEEAVEEEKTAAGTSQAPAGGILAIVIAVLVLAGAGVFLIFFLRRKRYLARSFTERSEEDLRTLLRRMKKRGYVRYPYESVRTFFRRVYWQSLAIDPKEAMEVCRIYEDAFFGERELTEEEWARQKQLADSLKKKPR